MAFATFSSETSASKVQLKYTHFSRGLRDSFDMLVNQIVSFHPQALNRLHQLRILGHTLVVEFAKDQDSVSVLKDPPVSNR